MRILKNMFLEYFAFVILHLSAIFILLLLVPRDFTLLFLNKGMEKIVNIMLMPFSVKGSVQNAIKAKFNLEAF